MLVIRELTVAGIWIRILAAVVLGGVIGLERGIKKHPAGLRTYMLVCIGACVVMIINQYAYQVYGTGDPVRMGAQVISGIGFLGAGTIIVAPRNRIRGLTTAAGLWAAACVGLAIGIGLYEVAFAGGGAVFLVLGIMHKLDFSVRNYTKLLEVYIELDKKTAFGSFIRNVREMDMELSNIQFTGETDFEDGMVSFTATLKCRKKFEHDGMIRILKKMEGVQYAEEI